MEGEAFGRRGIPAQVASRKQKEKAGREGNERQVHLSGTIGGWDSASSHGMVVVLRLRSRDQPDSADKGGGVVQVCVTKRGSTQNVPMDVDKVKANEIPFHLGERAQRRRVCKARQLASCLDV